MNDQANTTHSSGFVFSPEWGQSFLEYPYFKRICRKTFLDRPKTDGDFKRFASHCRGLDSYYRLPHHSGNNWSLYISGHCLIFITQILDGQKKGGDDAGSYALCQKLGNTF